MKESSLPEACMLPDGRVGVFVGGRYAYLPVAEARAFVEKLVRIVTEAEALMGASP